MNFSHTIYSVCDSITSRERAREFFVVELMRETFAFETITT